MPKRSCGEDEPKGAEGDIPELLAKSIKHCWDDEFLDIFREYFRKHAHKFEDMARGSEEHSLEYQELFNEYLVIFEGKLEEFIEREGSTTKEFYNIIKEHQSNPDPKVQLFINCLLASADYDSFFKVMKKEAQKSLRRERQQGLESKATSEESKTSGRVSRRSSSLSPRGECKEEQENRRSDERSYK